MYVQGFGVYLPGNGVCLQGVWILCVFEGFCVYFDGFVGISTDLMRISVHFVCNCKVFVWMLCVCSWIVCGFEKFRVRMSTASDVQHHLKPVNLPSNPFGTVWCLMQALQNSSFKTHENPFWILQIPIPVWKCGVMWAVVVKGGVKTTDGVPVFVSTTG